MKTRWLLKLRKLSKSLSARAALYCAGAIVAALAAVFFAEFVPDELAKILGSDAVDKILTILASSMLAVVTFSLSTLVASYSTITGSAPPRASNLIMEDTRAQSALSAFLGAFIFSIVALVALSTNYYGEKGRVILFFTTVVVLVVVIWTIIRWIGQLSGLGRIGNVISRVEDSTQRTIKNFPQYFAWSGQDSANQCYQGKPIRISESGFVQTLDLLMLSEFCETHGVEICVEVAPGDFVLSDRVVARLDGPDLSEENYKKVASCFVVGEKRTFEDDPRFGFLVLSEIGSRALSPSTNDQGTAIVVLSTLFRLVKKTREICIENKVPKLSQRLHIKKIQVSEIFDDSFRAISRDGAAFVEVAVFLQKGLAQVALYPEFLSEAKKCGLDNLQRCRDSMKHQPDIGRVFAANQKLNSIV